jgi:hypothetical protein
MTTAPTAPTLRRTPVRARLLRRPALALGGALTVLGLAAAACGGDSGGTTQTAEAEAVAVVASGDFLSTRTGAGIAAASGNPQKVQGDNPCGQSGAPSLRVAYVGPDLTELAALGLEAVEIEEPGLIIGAYANEVNFNGGISGRCVEYVPYLYSLADPLSSFTEICAGMAVQPPVFYFSLGLNEPVTACASRTLRVPVVALYTSIPDATLVGEDSRLFFIDDGTVEYLLARTLAMARSVSALAPGDRVGLLHGTGPTAGVGTEVVNYMIEREGLELVATTRVPAEQAANELLLFEQSVRLLEAGLSDAEQSEADQNLASLPPETAALFQQMEQFYIDAAETYRDDGVTALIATSDWSALRRMMRAAELVGWTPTWIANDMQPATLTMQQAPRPQVENLLMVSARRAAGDPVTEMDRSCVTLRNTAADASTFAYRLHSDGWTFMMSICDYLDVAFGALTRIEGDLTQAAFIDAMNGIDYETEHGAAITFAAGNRSGSDRFRVLQADPQCVLNSWGCMRAITEWTTPDPGAG